MNNSQFLQSVENLLVKNKVDDMYHILSELQFKYNDLEKKGKTHQEIIEILGTPESIVNYYLDNKDEELKSDNKQFKNSILSDLTAKRNNSDVYRKKDQNNFLIIVLIVFAGIIAISNIFDFFFNFNRHDFYIFNDFIFAYNIIRLVVFGLLVAFIAKYIYDKNK